MRGHTHCGSPLNCLNKECCDPRRSRAACGRIYGTSLETYLPFSRRLTARIFGLAPGLIPLVMPRLQEQGESGMPRYLSSRVASNPVDETRAQPRRAHSIGPKAASVLFDAANQLFGRRAAVAPLAARSATFRLALARAMAVVSRPGVFLFAGVTKDCFRVRVASRPWAMPP